MTLVKVSTDKLFDLQHPLACDNGLN